MRVFSYLLLPWILRPASVFVEATCVPNKWAQATGGITMKFVTTSPDNSVLYGIDENHDVHYRTGGATPGAWQPADLPKLSKITVTEDANIIWGVTVMGDIIYKEGNAAWQYVEANGKNWVDLAVSSDGSRLAGTDEVGVVWDRQGINNSWVKRSGNLMVVSYTANGEIGWGVDFDHHVYYRGGFTEPWVQVTGSLKYISVSADGEHVWGTNFQDIIFYRKGKPDFWKSMQGRAKQITVTGDGDHVYAVNRNNDVFYINGYPGFSQNDRRNARNVGVPMREVSVSESGDNIYGVDMENNLWHTAGIDYAWTQIPGNFKSVSVVLEHQLWTTNDNNHVYWRESENDSFMKLSGDLKYVEGSSDGRHVFGASPQDIMSWRAGRWPGELSYWTPFGELNERAKQITTNADGTHVWYVDRNNDVYYRAGYQGTQQTIAGPKLKQIAVSGDGNHVWGVAEDQTVYYRAGLAGDWIEAEVPLMDYISVNGDGEVVYGVNSNTGTTWFRYC